MMMRPRMMGLRFSATAEGRMIGTNSIMAGTASMKVPTNRKNATTTSRKMNRPPGRDVKNCWAITFRR